ncbi:hypothetical protein HRG_006027 [Hirsutella rhossiliensis]|uniref:Uncharacterized protein n=1 Tax=Hirsutella rhossiliensis TaxID=111463 RepID=A0A9P8MYW2_9HYPO|nr:uncharacterized protein HRG_06027 [Hirsutella rhossiliensis]KAH0963517.1 hypothetical protein HRG_06027 [Hirsutella rhossiliensis]
MRSATERHRGLTATLSSADLHQGLQMLDRTAAVADSRICQLLHGHLDGSAGIISVSNKKCAHSATHECPYLADSNSTLCNPCAVNAAKGQPCS